MRIIVFGATGMVGQGVLQACLLDDTVTDVLVIGRSATGRAHPKLREIHHADFTDFTPIQDRLSGYDACLFCLGTSAVGMSETDYRTITYDYTLATARALLDANPELVFCYVSGAGTDSTGTSRMMWARVKGETENALLVLSERACMFRPAFIVPLSGTQAKTKAYVALYRVVTPLYPLLRRIIPGHVTTSLRLGQAMLAVTRGEVRERVLDTAGINAAGS
ncbi:NAD-dependent epimerase/dehydratase family protein [Nocardia abscessus]|uniref:NAD-dependent epimerase/dehydratase family protein n=1 Tax=Nocardia abscessus TaxID=120957 RepID=UPI001892FCA5|nr:NAD-dependent epimerase/dehydratase family protein [Nocardia abscessus]MBF6339055.1 NAD-dependent epimerase/dehydratase family protein [Nocardia abscessus]